MKRGVYFSSNIAIHEIPGDLELLSKDIQHSIAPDETNDNFDDMLRRIMSHPVSRLRELLPDQWKPFPKDEYGMIIGSGRS